MLCEECGQNEASVHVQLVGPDGEATTKCICAKCMARYALTASGGAAGFIGAMLGSLAKHVQEEKDEYEATCPTCGRTYEQFKKNCLLGCTGCYRAFHEKIEEALIKHNGSASYKGCSPDIDSAFNVRKLKRELENAIAAEDYERAAQLRDSIKAVTSRG